MQTAGTSLSEKQLIRMAQAGDREAFSALYKMHWPRVYAVCLRITREASEAEDCAQEAFLQCFLRLSSFRGDSALSTWLHRLTVNVVLMRLRSRRRRAADMVAVPRDQGFNDDGMLTYFTSQDVRLAGTVDRIALDRALRRLPRGYRTVFVLHDVEGMLHTEIARKLGCTVGNSKSQLHQARLRLRRFLRRPMGRHNRNGIYGTFNDHDAASSKVAPMMLSS